MDGPFFSSTLEDDERTQMIGIEQINTDFFLGGGAENPPFREDLGGFFTLNFFPH